MQNCITNNRKLLSFCMNRASGIDFTGKSAVMYMCGRESILHESQQSCICVLGNRFYRKVSSHVYVR
jgi:hypothetical protein